jgi:hypothetical protein
MADIRRWACIAVALYLACPAAAQSTDAQLYYTRQPEMRIPFQRDAVNRLKQVQLYVSTDQGRNWQLVQTAPPDAGFFPPYTAANDGTYWFAVRALDFQDRPSPANLGQLSPQLKIVLDRKPPSVSLRQITDGRPNIVTIEWDVRDESFDPRKFSLEYRVSGSDWQREAAAEGKPAGTQSWRLEPGVRMDVRLRATDKAGNDAEQTLPVGLTSDGRPFDPPPQSNNTSTTGSAPATGPGGVRYSNSLRISLGYRIDRRPPSGMSFDLWYTKDRGATWKKAPRTGDAAGDMPPAPGTSTEGTAGKLIFEADSQGEFGFLIVARNGVGIGDTDPRSGDQPRYRVIVDTEAPKVAIKVQRGQGYDVRNVRIEWSADDPNLADRPVTIEYAEVKPDVPPAETDWKPIPADGLSGRLDRSGVQVWTVARGGPNRFMIRAKAEDRAGNVGSDQWREHVLVDLEHPSVNITSIDPVAR